MKRTMLMLCAASALAVPGTIVAVSAAGNGTHAECQAKSTKFERDQCERFMNSAAGDEYFGRMKMSYLGINNTFKDEAIRAGAYTVDPNVINKLNFADEALTDWSSKHPYDPDLARSYYLAIQVYKKVYLRPFQEKAWSYMQIETSRFSGTYFGRIVKADMAKGFTEHYFDLPSICPTPLPPGVIPQTMPSAAPTPSPRPGSPKVELIVPPCVPPKPTPSPTPPADLIPGITPTPATSTSPGVTPVPSATPTATPTANATGKPSASASSAPTPSAAPSATPTLIPPSPKPTHKP